MSDKSVEFRMKMGEIEIEYSGDPDLLKSQVLQTAKEVFDLFASRSGVVSSSQKNPSTAPESRGTIDLSTDTIATLLGVNSGSELLIAASAHLQFAKGSPKYSRQELIDEMRTAPNHFKETFVNNLTKYLAGLTRTDRLRAVGGDMYALSSKEKSALEAKLANA